MVVNSCELRSGFPESLNPRAAFLEALLTALAALAAVTSPIKTGLKCSELDLHLKLALPPRGPRQDFEGVSVTFSSWESVPSTPYPAGTLVQEIGLQSAFPARGR